MWNKPFKQTYILSVHTHSLHAWSLTTTRWHREARQHWLISAYVFTLDVTLDDVCVCRAQARLDVVWGDVCIFFLCAYREKKACRSWICARRRMVYVCKYPLSPNPSPSVSVFAWLGVCFNLLEMFAVVLSLSDWQPISVSRLCLWPNNSSTDASN